VDEYSSSRMDLMYCTELSHGLQHARAATCEAVAALWYTPTQRITCMGVDEADCRETSSLQRRGCTLLCRCTSKVLVSVLALVTSFALRLRCCQYAECGRLCAQYACDVSGTECLEAAGARYRCTAGEPPAIAERYIAKRRRPSHLRLVVLTRVYAHKLLRYTASMDRTSSYVRHHAKQSDDDA
jgi:hypothetical protein